MKIIKNYSLFKLRPLFYASITPSAIFGLYSIFNIVGHDIVIAIVQFIFGFFISLCHLILLALPSLYLVARKKNLDGLIIIFTFILCGAIPAPLLYLLITYNTEIFEGKGLIDLFFSGAFFGGTAGLVYWKTYPKNN